LINNLHIFLSLTGNLKNKKPFKCLTLKGRKLRGSTFKKLIIPLTQAKRQPCYRTALKGGFHEFRLLCGFQPVTALSLTVIEKRYCPYQRFIYCIIQLKMNFVKRKILFYREF
jgi:hypothetical protein